MEMPLAVSGFLAGVICYLSYWFGYWRGKNKVNDDKKLRTE